MNYAQYLRLGVTVFASPRMVLRAARGMVRPECRVRQARKIRHLWYRSMLQEHAAARDVYDLICEAKLQNFRSTMR